MDSRARIALALFAVAYLAVATTPCPRVDDRVPAAGVSDHAIHAGHASGVSGAPPPCHAPQMIVKAPCACGCGDGVTPTPLAKLTALRSGGPVWGPLAVAHPSPAALASLGEPDLAGVDPVPRPA